MNELQNKMVEGVVLGEVELVEGLQQYFIDIEGDYEYNVEFATLSEVDYKVHYMKLLQAKLTKSLITIN